MANSKRKCKYCKEYFSEFVKFPVGTFCTVDHAMAFGKEKADKDRQKQARKQLKEDKKRVKRRSEWMDNLQTLVNQYVIHVRDKGKPCCTCGNNNPSIKYDAGHYRSRGACQELRFELKNIHKQCSVKCNVHGSGMRAEYRDFIVNEYDQETLDWLDGPHKPLKEQFPHWTDIEKEIIRYRKLLRDAGIRPNY